MTIDQDRWVDLRGWLRDDPTTLPERRGALERTLALIAQTPQRRSWLPFPGRGRTPSVRDGQETRGIGMLPVGALLAVVALATGGALAGSGLFAPAAGPAASPAAPSASPVAASASPVPPSTKVIPWPGARGGPAGTREWKLADGPRWVHSVGDGSGPVEVTFEVLEQDVGIPVEDLRDAVIDLGGPPAQVAERAADVRLQAWVVGLDGATVLIVIKSFPDTWPARVAEAEAVVRSIRVDPGEPGGEPRLLFEFPAGWDTG